MSNLNLGLILKSHDKLKTSYDVHKNEISIFLVRLRKSKYTKREKMLGLSVALN